MAIKAVVMDVDGSTITHNNQLPDNLRDLMVNNPQIKWIIATGRSLELLKRTPIFEYISNDVTHIVDGGSMLVHKHGQIHSQHLLSQTDIDNFFSKLTQPEHINWLYYSPDGVRSLAYTLNPTLRERALSISDQVMVTESIAEFREWLRQHPTGKIFLQTIEEFDLSGVHYHQNENNFDVTRVGIHKGSGFVELLSVLNLTPEETVFVFNDRNDLPVINHPELQNVIKLKVGDYLPSVIADYHVATPHDVAAVLSQLINNAIITV